MTEFTNRVLIKQRREILWHAVISSLTIGFLVFAILYIMAFFLGNDLRTAIQLYAPIFAITSTIITGPADYYRLRIDRLNTIEKRLKTILTPIEIHLDSSYDGTPVFFRSPTPKWIDFTSGTVFLRKEIDEIIELLSEDHDSEPLVLLLAKSGSGKTNLAYGLAYKIRTELNDQYSHVYYENPANRTSKLVSQTTASGDLAYYQIERVFQDIINLLDADNTYRNKRVLVILDDVHRYYRLILGLGKRMNEYKHRISVLLIARAQVSDTAPDEWPRRIYDEPTEQLKVVTLSSEGYLEALKSITLSFLRHLNTSVDSTENLVRTLASQTGESLRLLSFILDEIPRNEQIEVTPDISAISICERLERYIGRLESSFIDEKLKLSAASDVASLKTSFREIVLCLAFFTQMEVAIPTSVLPNLTGIGAHDTNTAIAYLRDNAEIILVDGNSHPLFAFDHMSFGRALIKCHQSSKSILSSATFQYLNRFEARCIALLRHITENDLESPLFEILSFGNTESVPWKDLPIYLKEPSPDGGASLVPRLMEKAGAGFFGILSHLPGLLQSDAVVKEILDSLSISSDKSGLVEALVFAKDSDSGHILENENIVGIAATTLEHTHDGSLLLRGMKHHEALCTSPQIQASTAKTIEQSEYPWNLIKSISENAYLRNSEIIVTSIMNQSKRIAERIQETDNPEYPVFQIGGCKCLLENEDILSSISYQIENLDSPWSLVSLIASFNIGTTSPRIGDSIALRLRNIEVPQTIINVVGSNERLMANESLRDMLSKFKIHPIWSSHDLGPLSTTLRDSMLNEGFQTAMKYVGAFLQQTSFFDDTELQPVLNGINSELINDMMMEAKDLEPEKAFSNPAELVHIILKSKRAKEILRERIPEFDEHDLEVFVDSPAFSALFSLIFTETGLIPAMIGAGSSLGDRYYKRFERTAPALAELVEVSDNPWKIAIDLRGANALLNNSCIQEAFGKRAADIAKEIERSDRFEEIIAAVLEIDSLKNHELIRNAVRSRNAQKSNAG